MDKITIPQLRAARALLGWSQDDLADKSGVSKPTIARLELGEGELGGYDSTREKLRGALESAGVEFTNGGEPGVKLKRPTRDHDATHFPSGFQDHVPAQPKPGKRRGPT